jgi:ADP-heptose:LPS heptosyltransferase
LPEWRADEHEVQRWCRLLQEEGVDCDPNRLDLERPDVRLDSFLQGGTVIHPGAAKGARRWPVDRWAEVAMKEVAEGRQVLVTGSSDERSLALDLAERAGLPAGSVLAGRTDLVQLAAVVAASARVLSADTGVAHLATAFGVPSVILFGPTSPHAWGPPDRPHHRCLWKGAVGDPLADKVDPGLLAIQVDEVLKALEDLPEAAATAAVGSVRRGA